MSRQRETVAIVRLDAIGDFILTGPFLASLRAQRPDLDLVAVVQPRLVSLAERLVEVNRVIPVPGVRGQRPRDRIADFTADVRAAALLRSRGVRTAVIPRWDT